MTKPKNETKSPTLETSISEDELISGLLDARGREIEVIAFGISYAGRLTDVNVGRGYITIADGENQAQLEFERIESFRILS